MLDIFVCEFGGLRRHCNPSHGRTFLRAKGGWCRNARHSRRQRARGAKIGCLANLTAKAPTRDAGHTLKPRPGYVASKQEPTTSGELINGELRCARSAISLLPPF